MALEHALLKAWRRRGPLACALWPVSQVYRLGLAVRSGLYRLGFLKTRRLPVPVIVIGNVIAGGAGKTPTALAIAQHLKAQGLQVGIISRGYGRRTQDCREVMPHDHPLDTGDEPLLLRRRADVPVFVSRRRADAGCALLAAYPKTQVLLCDDGLQHRPLERDLEICVFDSRGSGNGWLLPAGPLREPWPRPADLILHTDSGNSGGSGSSDLLPGAFRATRRLSDEAIRSDGTRVSLASLLGQTVMAIAGIAQPQAFFDMLRGKGLDLVRTVALPDHDDFEQLPSLPQSGVAVLCTEKDAAKLWQHHPQAMAVPLHLELPATFLAALDARLSCIRTQHETLADPRARDRH